MDNVEANDLKALKVSEFELDESHIYMERFGPGRVGLNIRLRSMWGIHVLNLFIPSMIMIAASITTLFINKSHFEVNIQVALTTALVMYTLYGSVLDKLPDTGTIRMVDVWLMHGLLVPFVVFLALVSSKLLHSKKFSPKAVDKFDRICRRIIPLTTFMFEVTFFLIGFAQRI